ncbi:MAG: ABC transporter permease [Vicinamibacterales bacterium]
MNLLDAGCRAMLRLYPPDVRDAHGREMRQTFLEACARASGRGPLAMARTALAELIDLLKCAFRSRLGRPLLPADRDPHTSPGQQAPKGTWMNTLTSDLRQALRGLRAKPGTTTLAIGLLALAIGACTTMFTVADAIIFNAVPYRDADRLVHIGIARQPGAWPSSTTKADVIRTWRDAGIFEHVEAHRTISTIVDAGAGTTGAALLWITPGVLDMLGVGPIRGRALTPQDAHQTVPPILISARFWRTQLGAADDVIGRRIYIDGKAADIVGVMPADVRFPNSVRDLWRAIDLNQPPLAALSPIAKLKPGVPRDETARLAQRVARDRDPALVADPAAVAFAPVTGVQMFDDYTVNATRLLFTGVVLVLFVACVNVANLLLARAMGRRRERAVRAALGASRFRLVQQAMLESLVMATFAATLGLLLSWMAVSALDTVLPAFITARGPNAIDFDARSAMAVVALAVLATLTSGVLPAWLGTRTTASDVLKEGERGSSEGRVARRLTSALIVGEIAVAVTLLVGAALMVRTFMALANADRGIDTRNVALLQVNLPSFQVPDPQRQETLASEIHRRLAALPGVVQVMRALSVPPDRSETYTSAIETGEGARVEGLEVSGYLAVPGFFEFFDIRLVAGRSLSAEDPDEAVVISRNLADALWPGVSDPIGRTFRIDSEPMVRQVVGVSRNVRTSLRDPRFDTPEFFQPYRRPGPNYVIKLEEGARLSDDKVAAMIRTVHPAYLVRRVQWIDDVYAGQIERPQLAAVAAGSFAMFGLLVCTAGLFSVLSLAVARRRREFGIRLAIGAHPAHLSRLVARQTLLTLAAGLAIGCAGALAVARGLSSVLAGIEITDAASWVVVVVLITLAGAAAAWLPLRDARRTDPLLLLREE